MKQKRDRASTIILLLSLIVGSAALYLLVDDSWYNSRNSSGLNTIGVVRFKKGKVRLRGNKDIRWFKAVDGQSVVSKDSVFVSDDAEATITLESGTVAIQENSLVNFSSFEGRSLIELKHGHLVGQAKAGKKMVINTGSGKPITLTAEQDSNFAIRKIKGKTLVVLTKGKAKVTSNGKTSDITPQNAVIHDENGNLTSSMLTTAQIDSIAQSYESKYLEIKKLDDGTSFEALVEKSNTENNKKQAIDKDFMKTAFEQPAPKVQLIQVAAKEEVPEDQKSQTIVALAPPQINSTQAITKPSPQVQGISEKASGDQPKQEQVTPTKTAEAPTNTLPTQSLPAVLPPALPDTPNREPSTKQDIDPDWITNNLFFKGNYFVLLESELSQLQEPERDLSSVGTTTTELEHNQGFLEKYARDFWLWYGTGYNTVIYDQSIPGRSSLNYTDLRGPSHFLETGFIAKKGLGFIFTFKQTPGQTQIDNATIDQRDYLWKTLSIEGLFQKERFLAFMGYPLDISARIGFQNHQVPFVNLDALTNLQLKDNEINTFSLGFDADLKQGPITYEWYMRYQFPVSSTANNGQGFDITPVFAFDGSIGASYRMKNRFSFGTYWYGQWHQYNFKYTDAGLTNSGFQSLFYSNIELRIGYDF